MRVQSYSDILHLYIVPYFVQKWQATKIAAR